MLVAVAGASGKVGRRLIAFLHQRHMRVVALVRSRSSASALPKGTLIRLVDLQTGYGLPESLRDVTHLVNLTGKVDVSASERELYEANVVPTSHLLTNAPPKLRRFVHVSSIAVYGKKLRPPIDENSPRAADGPYARTKLEGERQALRHATHLPVVILQPGIIYGPTFEAGFYAMLRQLQKGTARLIGTGTNRLPLVHVDDVVQGIYGALSADVPSGSVFLLTPSESITQAQAFSAAAKLLGVKPPTRHVSPAVAKLAARAHLFVRRLQGQSPSITPEMINQLSSDRFFDSSRARKQLHWRPSISFKTGLKQVLSEYKQRQKK
jgi:nucleoside-diphosphate-sugar epimerase